MWLCLLVPAGTMALSIYSKTIYYYRQEELDYFSFRFIILSSCVFPAIFFSMREKKMLISATIANFLILILFDPLHELFNVRYSKADLLKESNYYFINVVVTITYAIMVGAILFVKRLYEDSEFKNQNLIQDLHRINGELLNKNQEIETQNQEIIAQTDNLNASQTKLQEAYQLIELQKEKLQKANEDLTSELVEINSNLAKTNSELMKHNNELRQFSYTVSHNLRGPVASLSGLINLIDKTQFDKETIEIFGHVTSSIQRLESIIKDLSNIIDIRHDIFHVRQKIDLQKEVNDIMETLKKEIDVLGITIKTNFDQCRDIFSVRPMLHSIMYNLITNAIKYRSHERPAEIEISCTSTEHYFVINVIDNGLGIDLKSHRENLFKLYKRFHFHTEGKGLGLYLTKLQAEMLGGYIEVESEINTFTRFSVYLAKPKHLDRQIVYEQPYASIFFDAKINATGVVWHGPVSSEQYRSVFLKCLEIFKAHHSTNYITDLRNQGYISHVDQLWMYERILPEAARHGIKKVAAIRLEEPDPKLKEYYNGLHNNLTQLGVDLAFFTSFEDAAKWITSPS